ncbi:CHAT domain-containing protein [Kribbella sp. NPDC051620]|uniref:CHAT domain-containing protein n=1 Tax=Kribbella sp. NPDC051620 TaxID=3364120 RepID=UPI0037942D6E
MTESAVTWARRRLVDFDRTADTAIVLAEEVPTHLLRLRAELESLQSGSDPWIAASAVAGRLYYLRSAALPEDDSWADYAAALHLLTPVADLSPDLVPVELRSVIGRSSTPQDQADAGGSLLTYCQEVDDSDALDLAVSLLGSAARGAVSTAARAGYQADLSAAYLSRFYHHGRLDDLTAAIDVAETLRAGASIADEHRSGFLSNLSVAYRTRFDHRGVAADIDMAIRLGEEALAAAPPEDAEYRGDLLAGLGTAHQLRYVTNWELADLEAAISHGRSAVDAEPDDDGFQADLGIALKLRFDRLQSPADLAEAIEHTATAADTTSSVIERIGYLTNLSNYHRASFLVTEDRADLTSAVDRAQAAVDAGAPNLDLRVSAMTALGVALHLRYREDEDPADLEGAVGCLREVVDSAAEDRPDFATLLSNLAQTYESVLESGGEITPEILTRLVSAVGSLPGATPLARALAIGRVAMVAQLFGAVDKAAELFRQSIQILPQVAPGWMETADREYGLEQLQVFVAEAVAAELAVDRAPAAVELAELGRGLLLSSKLDLQADADELIGADPQLVRQFFQVREQLAAAGPSGQAADARLAAAAGRRELDSEAGRLLGEIRRTAAGFLAEPKFHELRQAAGAGTIVLVNPASSRGDAILINAGREPITVPLPDLDADEVAVRAKALAAAFSDESLAARFRRPRVVAETLSWLSDAVTSPVLAALRLDAAGSRDAPRVWWLPIGQLVSLPLHAAGDALDQVVSSYAPTIRSLARATRRAPAASRRQLAVAMTATAGHEPLVHTALEAQALADRFPGVQPLVDEMATRAAVIAGIRATSWVHFACHAVEDPISPSRSGLILSDQILAVQELNRERFDSAELAYLSACSTARTSRSPDEPIHLASAFQLAGFRHVLATLWPVPDRTAAVAAQAFYANFETSADAQLAGPVANKVARQLRDEYPERPDLWAAFVHAGP